MLQECLTLCDPMNCSQPGSYIHGILQASILEWVAMPFTRGSSWPRMWTRISSSSCVAGVFFFFFFFTTEPLEKPLCIYISVQFSHSVMSDSLRPHGLQHPRPPCPLLTPWAFSAHVHQVSAAIQPYHLLNYPCPHALTFPTSGSFQWVGPSHRVAKGWEL